MAPSAKPGLYPGPLEFPREIGSAPPFSRGEAAVSGDAFEPRAVEDRRRDALLRPQPAGDEVPDRLLARGFADRRPPGDLVAPPGLDRLAAQAHVDDAAAHGGGRPACVGHAADAHHVAALLIVRVGVEEVVADVLEHAL